MVFIYLFICLLIYLFIALCCGRSCSTTEIKKSFLNQLNPRKIKNIMRKKNSKTTQNLAQKSQSMVALNSCIPDCDPGEEECFILQVWICAICWGSATPWRCFKMGTPGHWNWLHTPREPLGAVKGCSNEGFLPVTTLVCIKSSSQFYALLFSRSLLL